MVLASKHRHVGLILALTIVSMPTVQAAVDNVSKIVIRPALNAASNPLQIAEVIATENNTGVNRASAALGASVSSTGMYANNPQAVTPYKTTTTLWQKQTSR